MFRILMAILALLTLGTTSWAQTYPNHPVKIIVGFGAGGPDTTARILAAQLNAQTGGNFVVENHPGASGSIGADLVAHAAPDGYTLLVTSDSFAVLPSLYKKLPFDVIKDFAPVSRIAASEASFLVVNTSLPVQNLKDLIAYARDPKNKVAYGSSGVGSGSHLRMALFGKQIGAPLLHVPFKSPGEAVTALMGGEVQTMFITSSQALPLIKSGKIRALAYDYPTRASFLSDVPTMTEAGGPPSQVGSSWHALLAPAKTPTPVLAWLETETRKAVADPHVQQQLTNVGLIPVGSTSADFKKTLEETIAGMGAAAHAAGLQPQ